MLLTAEDVIVLGLLLQLLYVISYVVLREEGLDYWPSIRVILPLK